MFRYVPPNQFYMFERGLFPVALQTGDAMYGYASRAYWTDVGKPAAYLEVHHDILIGKLRYQFRGEQVAERIWLEGDADIHPSAQLVGPIVIGQGVRIEHGARIIGPTVIGANTTVAANATIEGAVLWEDILVEQGALLRSCAIGRGSRIGAKAHLADGAIVGDGCAIGAENRLEHGMRLWPGVVLPDHAISF